MSCHYAFCDAEAGTTVQGIGGFCDDHTDEARKIARLRDHGHRARNRQPAGEPDRDNQLVLEVTP